MTLSALSRDGPGATTLSPSATSISTADLDLVDSAGLSTYSFFADGSIAGRLDDSVNSYSLSAGSTTLTPSGTSNRLTSTAGNLQRTYAYDAVGNTTSDGTANFTYNFANRMASASKAGVTATYTYNALGQRVRKQVGATTTYFFYDEFGHLLGEYNGDGTLIEEIVWLGDIPVATIRPNGAGVQVFYIHTDHLNTPRRVTRPSDNVVVWRWDSDPFGEAPANDNPDGDASAFAFQLRFPGQFKDDESGLSYNYFRDYDPAVGRYTRVIPSGCEVASTPTSMLAPTRSCFPTLQVFFWMKRVRSPALQRLLRALVRQVWRSPLVYSRAQLCTTQMRATSRLAGSVPFRLQGTKMHAGHAGEHRAMLASSPL